MVTLRYLLDTNVLSEPMRATPDQKLLDQLRDHQHEIATAALVWHELLFGCYRLPQSRRRRVIEAYLAEVVATSVPILPYNSEAAKWHAAERARLASMGRTPPFVDGQIAAIAVVHDLVLVTANFADFADFEGVQAVSWLDSPGSMALRLP